MDDVTLYKSIGDAMEQAVAAQWSDMVEAEGYSEKLLSEADVGEVAESLIEGMIAEAMERAEVGIEDFLAEKLEGKQL